MRVLFQLRLPVVQSAPLAIEEGVDGTRRHLGKDARVDVHPTLAATQDPEMEDGRRSERYQVRVLTRVSGGLSNDELIQVDEAVWKADVVRTSSVGPTTQTRMPGHRKRHVVGRLSTCSGSLNGWDDSTVNEHAAR